LFFDSVRLTVSYELNFLTCVCSESGENKTQVSTSTDVNSNSFDAVPTSGDSGYPADDVTVTSSSLPLVAEAGIAGMPGELSAAAEDLGVSGTLVDFDERTLTAMTNTVSGSAL